MQKCRIQSYGREEGGRENSLASDGKENGVAVEKTFQDSREANSPSLLPLCVSRVA